MNVRAGGKPEPQWMAAPTQTVPGCPPGLEYLTQVDQLLVNQQVELLESMWSTIIFKLPLYRLTNCSIRLYTT